MKRLQHILVVLVVFTPSLVAQRQPYVPGPGDAWERKRPEALGMSAALLDSAIAFHVANESMFDRDLRAEITRRNAREPHPALIGPFKERGGPNGLVLRNGYIVAEWGDTRRVDMTFSVTKSFLSAAAGLVFDRGLIKDVHHPVKQYVRDDTFNSPQNAPITWHMLLQQTSEWEGTLWDKPDAADRRRGYDRQLQKPGTFWEYNDVRVNVLAYALLQVFRKPIPQILNDELMDPIGASDTWEYHGYDNSDVIIDGMRMKSVSGGGHWGGGWWVSTRDQARFGLLFLRNGMWGERRILSNEWIRLGLTRCDIRPVYGYLWWLNTDKQQWPQATERTFAALGAGTNAIVIVPEYDLVIVVRWINTAKLGELIGKVLAAVNHTSGE